MNIYDQSYVNKYKGKQIINSIDLGINMTKLVDKWMGVNQLKIPRQTAVTMINLLNNKICHAQFNGCLGKPAD